MFEHTEHHEEQSFEIDYYDLIVSLVLFSFLHKSQIRQDDYSLETIQPFESYDLVY